MVFYLNWEGRSFTRDRFEQAIDNIRRYFVRKPFTRKSCCVRNYDCGVLISNHVPESNEELVQIRNGFEVGGMIEDLDLDDVYNPELWREYISLDHWAISVE